MTLNRILIILMVILISIPVSMLYNISVSTASGDPVNEDKNPPINGSGYSKFSGTWFVESTDDLTYANQTIELTGDLIINASGKLRLENMTLEFNCSDDSQFGIKVENGGSLEAVDSEITCPTNKTFYFRVYGDMDMDGCNVSRMYGEYEPINWEFIGGIEIYSVNVTINNTYFHHNMNNIYIHTSSNGEVKIMNNTIVEPLKDEYNFTDSCGIVITDNSRPFVYRNRIYNQVDGIQVREGAEAKIDNNTVAYSEWDGIWVIDWAAGNISHNNLHHCYSSGIAYGTTGSGWIKNNHIRANYIDGINIYGGNPWIYNNVIENNSETGINVANWWYDPRPVIEKNQIKYNGVGSSWGGYGIYVDSSHVKISRNTITNNGPLIIPNGIFKGGGIFVVSTWDQIAPQIDNNSVSRNAENGIDVDIGAQPLIEFNNIEYNNRTGVCIDQETVVVSKNTIRYNRIGIHENNGGGAIKQNIISYQDDYGIKLEDGSRPDIKNNEITRNGDGDPKDSGIFLDGLANNCNALIAENDISNNTGNGVRVEKSSPKITGNRVNYNKFGLHFSACSGAVTNNLITHNLEAGITAELNGAAPAISTNTIKLNKYGIQARTGAAPSISANWLMENDVGLSVSDGAKPDVQPNYFMSNQIGLQLLNCSLELAGLDIATSTTAGVYIKNSHVTLSNCTLTNSPAVDLKLDDDSQVISLNTTFDKGKSVFLDAQSRLNVRWFLHLSVLDEKSKPLAGANVKITNNTDGMLYDRILKSSGRLDYLTLTEYFEKKNGRIYSTPHSVSIEKEGYVKYKKEITVDTTKSVVLPIAKNSRPGNITSIRPGITHNLLPLITWSAAVDLDGDTIEYVLNIGSKPMGDDIVNSSAGKTMNTYFQVAEPLTYGSGNTTYYITIYAFDGKGGESVTKSPMFVVNSAPTVPFITLQPGRPNKLSELTCRITNPAVDIDNDTVKYNYVWYKNGEVQAGLSVYNTTEKNISLPGELINDDERWKCSVTAFDGYVYSPASETDEVVIKNFAPFFNGSSIEITIDEDTVAADAFNLNQIFIDSNGDELIFTWDTNEHVEVLENDSWISFKPGNNWFGEVKFKFTAEDPFTKTDVEVTVKVKPVNDPPVLEPVQDVIINEDEWYNLTISASDDADGDMLFFSTDITNVINGLYTDFNYKFNINTGILGLKPDNSMVGSYQIQVTVDDKKSKVSGKFNLTIQNVNDAPTAIITKPEDLSTFKAGEMIALDGSDSTDEDFIHGDLIRSARWVTSDGKVLNSSITGECKIKKPGDYILTLIVTDLDGAEGRASISVTILEDDTGDGKSLAGSPMIIAVILVVIILIVITLFFFMRSMKRKGESKTGAGAEPSAEAATATVVPADTAQMMPQYPMQAYPMQAPYPMQGYPVQGQYLQYPLGLPPSGQVAPEITQPQALPQYTAPQPAVIQTAAVTEAEVEQIDEVEDPETVAAEPVLPNEEQEQEEIISAEPGPEETKETNEKQTQNNE